MDLTGRLCEISRDFKTRKPLIKFLVNEDLNGIEAYDGKDLKIKVVERRHQQRHANPYR